MRQLFTALALLAALTAGLLLLGRQVDGLTGPMVQTLDRALRSAQIGDWDSARELTARAAADWEEADGWLRLTETHQTVSEVAALLDEAEAYAAGEEPAPFRASVRRAARALTVLRTAEEASWGNLL